LTDYITSNRNTAIGRKIMSQEGEQAIVEDMKGENAGGGSDDGKEM